MSYLSNYPAGVTTSDIDELMGEPEFSAYGKPEDEGDGGLYDDEE